MFRKPIFQFCRKGNNLFGCHNGIVPKFYTLPKMLFPPLFRYLCRRNNYPKEKTFRMTAFLFYTLLIATAVYAFYKFRYELHLLQLNSYRNERFIRWFKGNYSSADRGLEFVFLLLGLLITFIFAPVGMGFMLFTLIFLTWRFHNRKYKKALVFTDRAKRIYGVALLLFFVLAGLWLSVPHVTEQLWEADDVLGEKLILRHYKLPLLYLLLIFSPLFILLANTLLKPYEKYNHNWYINDAKKMLTAASNLRVIGITGSYGKTSVKHFLHSILAQKYNVLMTPGSFNTPMGVVRTVREQLKPFHEIFIAEMGAKQPGDIKEICDIAHPEIGILTAVGTAHLETFKTVDNIRKTKFELIDALPADGFAVLNADYEIIKKQTVSQPKKYYGVRNAAADFSVENVKLSPRGSQFDLMKQGEFFGSFETKLLGEHNLSNLAAAAAAADYLGVSVKQMQVGIKKLQPVQHRLSIRRIGGQITILDDAFNSNEVGARMAVEVLGQMEGKRKIIVTPGMVELGERTAEINRNFGRQIAKSADLAIIVNAVNAAAISAGLADENFPESQIFRAKDFAEATAWLGGRMQSGDVILYENDLPDSYK